MKKIMNGSSLVTIIHEDNHLLVVDKPAGMPSQPDESARSRSSIGCESIRRRYDKPGNVFVGLVHRLDQPVSGVVVLARTGKAAVRLAPIPRGDGRQNLLGDRRRIS